MILRITLGAALVVALAAPASAAPVELTTRIFKERRTLAADGTATVTLVTARKAIPGDRLVYVLTYRNTGVAPVASLVLDNPLPPGVAYRSPAAGSSAPELSVDGVKFGPLGALTAENGARAASPDDVRRVRWRVAGPIASGVQGQVSFRAVLK